MIMVSAMVACESYTGGGGMLRIYSSIDCGGVSDIIFTM